MSQEQDKFLKVRRGVFEHLTKGWIDETMLVAYMILLDQCDYSTGVWRGSAMRLARSLNWKERKAQRTMALLVKAKYITSARVQNGLNHEYKVLINNYTPPTSKTTARMRPMKAGLNREAPVKNDASVPSNLTPTPVKNDASVPSNLTHKYQDSKTYQDSIQDGPGFESGQNSKTRHRKSGNPPAGVAANVTTGHAEYLERMKRERNGD